MHGIWSVCGGPLKQAHAAIMSLIDILVSNGTLLNIKFASCPFDGKKVDAGENPDFVKLQSVGIRAIGERVNMQEQAKYRYHIDLGGGKDIFCFPLFSFVW